MRCTPMIVVRDVEASSAWYQELLGLTSAHGGSEFEMLMSGHELLLCLHHLDFSEHPALSDPTQGGAGRGTLLYFSVDDLGPVFERAEPFVRGIARVRIDDRWTWVHTDGREILPVQ